MKKNTIIGGVCGNGQVQTCRCCGCTDADCSWCIERTGEACAWVREDLCSACYAGLAVLLEVKRTGSDNIARVRIGRNRFTAHATSGHDQAALRLAEKVGLSVGADAVRVERLRCRSIKYASGSLVIAFAPSGD